MWAVHLTENVNMLKGHNIFDVIFLVAFVVGSLVRVIYTVGQRKIKAEKKYSNVLDIILISAAGIGMDLPFLYLFTSWFDFANYSQLVGNALYYRTAFDRYDRRLSLYKTSNVYCPPALGNRAGTFAVELARWLGVFSAFYSIVHYSDSERRTDDARTLRRRIS
jgi:hypothetical protein